VLPDPVRRALGVAVHGVDLGHLRFGGTASVIGRGPIGLLLLSALKAAGASSVLGSAEDAFGDAARRGGLKVVIEPQR
jgi:L-iditol 2-dehydrogenase